MIYKKSQQSLLCFTKLSKFQVDLKDPDGKFLSIFYWVHVHFLFYPLVLISQGQAEECA